MNWLFTKKQISSEEYLELKQTLGEQRIKLIDLELELALILRKLKFKYKINSKSLKDDETETIKGSVLLPEA